MKDGKLSLRERRFCESYVMLCDAGKAAQVAGYRNACNKRGEELLCREDIRSEIARICELKKQTSRELARAGYERLAFGSISDAVSLLYLENPTRDDLKGMDLYCISEIKRPKDGSMEIKFFDRLKALEKLTAQCSANDEDKAKSSSVYEAILMGAKALGECGKDGD